MGVRLQDLGPAAQRQVIEKLRQLDKPQKKARAGPATDEGSKLEQEYYTAFIWPKELAGEIDHVERHVRFELLPKAEYCGVSLPAAHYTPDFLIYYKSGDVEAVEVKHEAIRKNQRDYIYRRRLFIDNIARPNGWRFTEYIKREEKNNDSFRESHWGDHRTTEQNGKG